MKVILRDRVPNLGDAGTVLRIAARSVKIAPR